MSSSLFDSARRLLARNSTALFARGCTLYPMASAGPNAPLQADTARQVTAQTAVRAEWASRIELGDNGMGRSSGAFRLGVNAPIARATIEIECLPWLPRQNDEITWHDRPGERYRISEVMPDGGTTLTFTLNKITV